MAVHDRHHDGNILASHGVNANASHQRRRTWDSAIADDDANHTPKKRARMSDLGLGDCHPLTRPQKSLSHDAYTVGWVAALPVEMAAAKAMLDDIHQPLAMSRNDSNVYVFGNISNHNIVIACLPSGQYGITSAALVANNMRWSFPSIQIRLMVGIGGGVPDKVDVRLGDVVISNPTTSSSGIIQYDFGKTVKAGRFQLLGALNKPPQQLLTAVAKLRADHQLGPSRISEHLATMRERNPSMDAYKYCGAGQDRLYDPAYEHVGDSCDECDLSQLVRRDPRPSNCPKIHYGVIASANQVMKHGQTRRRLAHELDVLCFEMEAAGLMDSFPCLVVRGISDYSDSHKAKQWQEYAAATAAAYAKELLSVIPSEQINQGSMIDVNISPSREKSSSDRRTHLLDSLRFDAIDSRHSTIKSAHAKTCQWLLKHPYYIRWLDVNEFVNHHGILWIRGKPGAGKSTIMKYAFSRAVMQTANNAAVISFFFNARGESLEKSTEGMHRSLLLQLLKKVPELQQVLDSANFATLSGSGSDSCTSEVRTLFSRAVAKLGQRQVTCFIDALDECDEGEVRQMLDFFEDLGQNAVQNSIGFYVCFSSRHYPYMDVQYGVRFTLEDQKGHQADLEGYVRSKMKTVTRKQADELIQEILRKASGVFMWVVLVIDILNKDLQRGRIFAVKKRLQEIPPKLSDLFRDILTRDTENMDDLLLSLQWILFCKRPLRLEEYYFALAAGLEPESLAEWDSSQITKEVMNQFVVSSSKGLAEITKSETAAVQFIHESVRDFLLKDDGLTSLWPDLGDNPKGRSHVRLMNCCHSYTKVDVSAYVQPGEYFLEEDKSSAENLREQVAEKFPRLEYATNQLLYHADAAESLGVLQKSFLREFASSLDNWTKLHNLFEQDKISRYTQRTSPLYIFADLGFASLADNTARDSQQLPTYSSPFERFPTPLHAAVHGQHVGAVKVLIRHMTSEEINMPHRTSLFMAMPARNASIVKILLEAGADMYLRGNGGSDLFSWAIIFGLQDIVKLLLPRNFSVIASRDSDPPVYPAEDEAELLTKDGVDVNMDPLTRQISLYCAVRAGEKFTVKFLLDNGGEPDYRYEPSGRTLLHLAVSMGNKPMVLLLLENGANIDPCGCDVSPLKLALRCGAEEISKVLLEKGANLNITDDRGHTALHVAAQKGCVKLVETIVDMGADISCTDLQGSTPLSLACKNQNHDVAAFLFDRGARIEEDESSNVAHPYTEGLHKQVAQLLQLDANEINGRDELGRTPLFEACHLGALDIVKSLLERGADATVTDNQGQTALFAVQRSHVHSGLLVRVLVEARADPMRQNTMGKTFLDASYGFPTLDIRRRKHIFERVGQRLLDEGYGLFNRTLLAHAAVSNDVPEVAFLLYLGANPDMKDSQGDTILHDIVRAGYAGTRSHIICLLLEGGADAGILNADNSTPLDLARRHGNDMVSILRSTLERSHLGQTHISQVSEDNS